MRRSYFLVLLLGLGLRCATTEDAPDHGVPGGVVDGGKDQSASGGSGGTGGSGGASGSSGSGGAEDAGTDSSDASDSAVDAGNDVADSGPPDSSDAGPDADGGPVSGLVLVGRSASNVVFGTKQGASWTTSSAPFSAASAPAVVATSTGALAVVRRQSNDELDFATWTGSTGWSGLFPVGAAGATLGTPALARHVDALLVFLGTDNKIYENRWTGSWQGFQPVSFGSVQSFGPSAPSLGTLPAPAYVIAQEGSDGDLYTQTWSTTWQAAHAHGLLVDVRAGTPPSVTQRGSSAVVAYVETGSDKILWTQGSGSTWSSPVEVPNATTTDPIAITTLDNGDVLLAYRGKDQKIATSISSGSSFAAPVSFSATATGSPSVAPGVDGHQAEIAFLTGGAIVTSSLVGTSWSATSTVATGNQEAVAIARVQP